ncbi:hypothetical protein P3T76_004424 [Phytophthora citrophthora]|uniref:Uncharacterized protein n=1 Tax=Phytophthora citrophthora TaxID=4793 RepID=A0AAD9LRC3_9STRA|nr:hypothetical protein P3T76_004424 [Phytophthora citrophthora]
MLHVMYRVSDLLDNFSIHSTIVDDYKRTGTVTLMQYVAAREDPNKMNVSHSRWLFNAATELAADSGDLESLQWLMESYLPDEYLTKAVAAVATSGHMSLFNGCMRITTTEDTGAKQKCVEL